MRSFLFALVFVVLLAGKAATQDSTAENGDATKGRAVIAARAERYFRGEYGGRPEVVDELASDRVIVSYPIFEEIYGKAALRGKEDVKVLCANFVRKWVDRKLDIREVIVDDKRVVMIWGLQARFVNNEDDEPSAPIEWAGISVLCFDENGKIEKEYGLESPPGAFSQLLAGELTDDVEN